MSYSKEIVSGPLGSVVISEEAGKVKIAAIGKAELGGASLKGFVAVQSTNEIDLDALHLMDVGFDLAIAKFPQFAVGIQMLKALMDAEVAKL